MDTENEREKEEEKEEEKKITKVIQDRINVVRQDLKKNETKNDLIARHVRALPSDLSPSNLPHPAVRQSIGPLVSPFIWRLTVTLFSFLVYLAS